MFIKNCCIKKSIKKKFLKKKSLWKKSIIKKVLGKKCFKRIIIKKQCYNKDYRTDPFYWYIFYVFCIYSIVSTFSVKWSDKCRNIWFLLPFIIPTLKHFRMLNLISEKSFQSTNQLVASQFSRMKCQFKIEIVTKSSLN